MWTNRQEQILEMIIMNPSGIFGAKIAENIGVSDRTVRTDIYKINNDLKNFHCKILSDNKKGYYISTNETAILSSIFFEAKQKRYFKRSEDRQTSLLGFLFFNDEFEIDELSETFYISTQTVIKELNKLNEIISNKMSSKLFKLSSSKVIVNQNEALIRKCFLIFLKDESLKNTNLNNNRICSLLSDWYIEDEFNEVVKIIKEGFFKESLILSDEFLFLIAWAVYFSLTRNKHGYFLSENLIFHESENKTRSILERTTSKFSVFSKTDIYFLDQFVWPLKLYERNNEGSNKETLEILNEFSVEVKRKYGFDLRESKTMCQNIEMHIEYMTRRLQTGYEFDNPLKKHIKEKYALAYEIAMLIVPIVYKHKQKYLLDGEVSYIAIYIEYFMEEIYKSIRVVIVSRTSSAFVQVAKEWLFKNFPNQMEIINTIPSHLVSEFLNENDVDLIITLSSPIEIFTKPVYVIKDLPNTKDRVSIYEILNKIHKGRKSELSIQNKFNESTFKIFYEADNFKFVLHDLCLSLEKNGYVLDGERYLQDLLLREKNYPTFLSPSLMIPHPLDSPVIKSNVAVGLFPNGLKHDGKEIKIIFLLAIEEKIDPEVNALFQLFKEIANNKLTIENLCSSKNFAIFKKNLLSMAKENQLTI